MKKILASKIKLNDVIVGTPTKDGKRIYSTIKPLKVDSIFMNVRIANVFPSDEILRFNVNGMENCAFPQLGCISFHKDEYVLIKK